MSRVSLPSLSFNQTGYKLTVKYMYLTQNKFILKYFFHADKRGKHALLNFSRLATRQNDILVKKKENNKYGLLF